MKRRLALAALFYALGWLAAAWNWLGAPLPRHLTVTFLDVGQGDCIFIRTPSGKCMLVDTGRLGQTSDSGRDVALPFLRAQGINRLEAILLTHSDDDHIGGAASILMRMPVDRLLVSPLPSSSPNYAALLRVSGERGGRVTPLVRGMSIDFRDGVVADVLNPPDGRQPKSQHPDNDGSLVIRIRFGRTSFLLTGDAEEAAEADIERSGRALRSDVLKLGHHGSRTSTLDRFLDSVQPQLAIVSAGRGNMFGHPNPLVLARLSARRVPLLRTDERGSIALESDGDRISVRTQRPPARH